MKRVLGIARNWIIVKGRKLTKGRWKIALIITAAALAIGLTPVAVKAATGGEVDIYSEIWAAITALSGRVDAQDDLIAEQAAEIEELRELLAEAEEEAGETEEVEEEGEGQQSGESASPPPPAGTPSSSDDDGSGDAAGDPESEPYVNPYAHLSIDHLHIATADGVARFGDYRIKGNLPKKSAGVNNPPGPPPFPIIGGDGICFGSRELSRAKKWLDNEGATYTVEAIYIDPLLYEIVAGKKFHDGPDVARRYINRVIAGKKRP